MERRNKEWERKREKESRGLLLSQLMLNMSCVDDVGVFLYVFHRAWALGVCKCGHSLDADTNIQTQREESGWTIHSHYYYEHLLIS